jgi:hypothetical protein
MIRKGLVDRGGGGIAMRVLEREKGHYEVHEVPYGKVYSWCPERVRFECDCGEVLTWTVPVTLCGCSASYTDIPSQERGRKGRFIARGSKSTRSGVKISPPTIYTTSTLVS